MLALVGLQVWRGALLLADWLLHNGNDLAKSTNILELGSGTGLTSIIAAIYAPVACTGIFCKAPCQFNYNFFTDLNKGEILALIKSNISRNNELIKYPIKVTEIDFTNEQFNSEIINILPSINIVIAADGKLPLGFIQRLILYF